MFNVDLGHGRGLNPRAVLTALQAIIIVIREAQRFLLACNVGKVRGLEQDQEAALYVILVQAIVILEVLSLGHVSHVELELFLLQEQLVVRHVELVIIRLLALVAVVLVQQELFL